jgi:HSP20 family protein
VKFLYDEPFGGPRSGSWAPRADIYRTPQGWVVKFDLAGVRPDEITVEAEPSQIRVSGVRRDRFVERGFRHHSMEISYSRFERTVRLPCRADVARIETQYEEGMLIVVLETDGD